MTKAWIIVWGLMAVTSVWAEEPSEPPAYLNYPVFDLRMAETKPDIYVGDTVLLRVENLDVPPGGGDTRPNRDALIDVKAVAKLVEDAGFVVTDLQDRPQFKPAEFWLAVVPVKSGKLSLPSLPIVPKSENDGKMKPFRTQPVDLEIRTALDNQDPNQKPVDYRMPLQIKMPWYMLLAILGLAAGALYGGYRLWRKKSAARGMAAEPEKPLLPEDQEALLAFRELDQRQFVSQQKFKPHYFGASEILKRYLGRRYGIDAMEATSSELIRLLKDNPMVEAAITTTLKSLFERLDQVKFTDQLPPIVEANHLVMECQAIVDRTKRIVVEAAAPEGTKVS